MTVDAKTAEVSKKMNKPAPPQKSEVRKAELKVARLEARLSRAVGLGHVLAKLSSQLNVSSTGDLRARDSLASFIKGVEGQLEELVASRTQDAAAALGSVVVRAAFVAGGDCELSALGGDVIEVLRLHDSGWLYGRRNGGQTGWLPCSFCRVGAVSGGLTRWRAKLDAWGMTAEANGNSAPTVPSVPPPKPAPALPPKRRDAAQRPLAPTPTSVIPSMESLSTSPQRSPARPLIPKKPSAEAAKSWRRSSEVRRRTSESEVQMPAMALTGPTIDASFLADLISEVQLLELEELSQAEGEGAESSEDNGKEGKNNDGEEEEDEAERRPAAVIDKRGTLSLGMDECADMLGALDGFN